MVFTGRLALLAAVAAAFVAFVLPSWLGVLLATGTLCAVALADICATAGHRLEFSRTELTVVRLGRGIDIELSVLNAGPRLVRGTLWDDWPLSTTPTHRAHELTLPPQSRTRLTTTLTPTLRGDRTAGPITIRLIGPLGVAGRQFRRVVSARVRTLPPFHSERLLPSRVKLLQHHEGLLVATVRGQGTEFDSVREYVMGDDVRSIDWRSSARAHDVMVRTWRPERNRHVLMILDTGRAGAPRIGDTTRLDANIEAALLLGGLASAAGDTVDLLAYDRQIRTEVHGITGKRLQLKLMHAMSGLTPTLTDTDVPALIREAIRRTRRRSLIVLFTGLDPATVAENLLPALPVLAHRHRVILVSVTDPDLPVLAEEHTTPAALYHAAAAYRSLADRSLARESLRRIGITVITAPPATLPTALADQYLELKRSGLM